MDTELIALGIFHAIYKLLSYDTVEWFSDSIMTGDVFVVVEQYARGDTENFDTPEEAAMFLLFVREAIL